MTPVVTELEKPLRVAVVVQLKTASIKVFIFSGKIIDQTTNPTVIDAETQNTSGSKGLVFCFCVMEYLFLCKKGGQG